MTDPALANPAPLTINLVVTEPHFTGDLSLEERIILEKEKRETTSVKLNNRTLLGSKKISAKLGYWCGVR